MKTQSHMLALSFGLTLVAGSTWAGLEGAQLRCEYRENPLGIEAREPRLSWQLNAHERGQKQTAYRVLVATSPESLKRGEGDLWDSGRVESDQSLHVRYAGRSLASRQAAFWKVQVWDKDGHPGAWSQVATWELGLPGDGDWAEASWIRLAQDTRNSPLTQRTVLTRNMNEPRSVQAFPVACQWPACG